MVTLTQSLMSCCSPNFSVVLEAMGIWLLVEELGEPVAQPSVHSSCSFYLVRTRYWP